MFLFYLAYLNVSEGLAFGERVSARGNIITYVSILSRCDDVITIVGFARVWLDSFGNVYSEKIGISFTCRANARATRTSSCGI
jgi:hypothetical protein